MTLPTVAVLFRNTLIMLEATGGKAGTSFFCVRFNTAGPSTYDE
jgi:hypothetical protein